MDDKQVSDPLDPSALTVIQELSGKGKRPFYLEEFATEMSCNRVRACKILLDLKKTGRVKRVNDGQYASLK